MTSGQVKGGISTAHLSIISRHAFEAMNGVCQDRRNGLNISEKPWDSLHCSSSNDIWHLYDPFTADATPFLSQDSSRFSESLSFKYKTSFHKRDLAIETIGKARSWNELKRRRIYHHPSPIYFHPKHTKVYPIHPRPCKGFNK